jgi:hypothetical protein
MTDSGRGSTGRSVCESALTKPWPGKCLPTAAVPAARSPRASARASAVTARRRGGTPVADHRARAVIEIEHRREAEVDAVRAQLHADGAPVLERRGLRGGGIRIPLLAERAHRRNRAEARAKPLHAPALVVDRDQQRRIAQRVDVARERRERVRRRVVAREQDRAADERMAQSLAVRGAERRAFDPDDERPARQREGTTPHAAASRISDFISRTASRNPTNTARETIACRCAARARRERRDRLHVEIVERVARVEAHAVRADRRHPHTRLRELA